MNKSKPNHSQPLLLNYGRGLVRSDQILTLETLAKPTARGFEHILKLQDGSVIWLRRADAEILYESVTGKKFVPGEPCAQNGDEEF